MMTVVTTSLLPLLLMSMLVTQASFAAAVTPSQEGTTVFDPSADRWVPERSDALNVKIGSATPSLTMSTRPTAPGATEVDFLPNTGTKTFVGFGYRNLGFSISKSNPRSEEQNATYGTGDSTDVQAQLYGRTWTQLYFYQSYRGYYIKNTSAVDPAGPSDRYITRPDVSTSHYGVDFIYNFQPGNYSTGAAFNQSGHQVTSGGAWLAMAGLHNHVFRSNPQLVPAQVSAPYGELATLQGANLLQLSLGGGGGYTLTSDGHWFASGQLLLGLAGVYQSFDTKEYDYHNSALGTLGISSLALGYNGVRHYVAMQLLVDAANYTLPTTGLQIASQQVQFQYGYRFEGVSLPLADRWSSWLDGTH